MIILRVTSGIDFYNVLFPVPGKLKSQPVTSRKGKYMTYLQPDLNFGPFFGRGFLPVTQRRRTP
jgi:hypothetical protein